MDTVVCGERVTGRDECIREFEVRSGKCHRGPYAGEPNGEVQTAIAARLCSVFRDGLHCARSTGA